MAVKPGERPFGICDDCGHRVYHSELHEPEQEVLEVEVPPGLDPLAAIAYAIERAGAILMRPRCRTCHRILERRATT